MAEPLREQEPRARRRVSRRNILVLAGVGGATWLLNRTRGLSQAIAESPPAPCLVRPEQTEGPYFVDERLNRSDIRADPAAGRLSAGTPFTLTIQVSRSRAGECYPLPHAQVDIWHCDASGVYSDVRDPGFNTVGKKFLRGYQMTDAKGQVRFLTIYPGWYPIRTVHIHFKVRTGLVSGKHFEFTSQLYFPDDLTDRVHRGDPYAAMGPRRVRNRQDFIFRDGGHQLVLDPSPIPNGFGAAFPIGLEIP